MIDRLPDEPVIAFVYLDTHAGPSAKGGLASQHDLAAMPSRTIRLSPQVALRELSPAELVARQLPPRPSWLEHYGPQPDLQSPWHKDPLLRDTFHAQYPDDVQTFVHDGDPRRMGRGPELCWVRIKKVERGPTRQVRADYEPSRQVFVGELLNTPHTLSSVKKGDWIKLISVHGLAHPLHVTDEYLRERAEWSITPCDRCGASECFDPPSVMARVRFPETPADTVIQAFTSICSHCGGIQQLTHV